MGLFLSSLPYVVDKKHVNSIGFVFPLLPFFFGLGLGLPVLVMAVLATGWLVSSTFPISNPHRLRHTVVAPNSQGAPYAPTCHGRPARLGHSQDGPATTRTTFMFPGPSQARRVEVSNLTLSQVLEKMPSH